MIDDIVKMILKEARPRKGVDLVSKIDRVMMEIQIEIINVFVVFRDQERRGKENRIKERYVTAMSKKPKKRRIGNHGRCKFNIKGS